MPNQKISYNCGKIPKVMRMRLLPTAILCFIVMAMPCMCHAFVILPLSVSNHAHLYAVEREDEGVVLGRKYVLTNEGEQSTSGKSTLVEAMPHQRYADMLGQQQPTQSQQCAQERQSVLVKFSDNIESLKREKKNYDKVTNKDTQDLFVKIHDFYNPSEKEEILAEATTLDEGDEEQHALKGQAALVMERGAQDLKHYLKENGPLMGEELRQGVATTARIVKAIHSQKMVWTELKSSNFVVQQRVEEGPADKNFSAPVPQQMFAHYSVPTRSSQRFNTMPLRTHARFPPHKYLPFSTKPPSTATNPTTPVRPSTASSSRLSIKAIDLESAVKKGKPPIDFSPEAIPPEFATAFLCGREPFMEMQKTFDIFSLGLLWYEMATGASYWQDKFGEEEPDLLRIAMELRVKDKMTLLKDAPIDEPLKSLIKACLAINEEKRPAIDDVLAHPYIAEYT